MLVVFPFEEEIYRKAGIPVTYVGHPLAELIPLQPDVVAARSKLGLAPDARVVTISGGLHRMGRINFEDLQGERGYGRWRAYAQSKLANLLFAFELDRRLRAAGSTVRGLAAHPGYAATNIGAGAGQPMLDRAFGGISKRIFAQSAEMGALPILYAATYPGLDGGTFAGPDRLFEAHGYPKPAGSSAAARNKETARKLWEVSEELTGVRFTVSGATRLPGRRNSPAAPAPEAPPQ